MLFSPFRKIIDTYLYPVGVLFRKIRDVLVYRRAWPTPYGFTLAGERPAIIENGWEPEQAALFVELLNSHDIVVDIGANVGFYSCLAGQTGKPVIAVEPSARNLHYLVRNLKTNHISGVEVFPVGLAGSSGSLALYGYGGMASFVPGWAQSKPKEVIKTITLDKLLAGRFVNKRLLIKVDVEGFELEVLKGAADTLQRHPHPTWLMEVLQYDSLIPGGRNPNFEATLEVFQKAGYLRQPIDKKNFLFAPIAA